MNERARLFHSTSSKFSVCKSLCLIASSVCLCGSIVFLSIIPFITDSIELYLLYGSLVSLLCNGILFLTSSTSRIFANPPNPLIYNKSIIDTLLAIVYIIQFYVHFSHFLEWIQMLVFTSECWFCVMSIDLYKTINNPFSVFAHDLKTYRLYCIVLGVFSALLFNFTTENESNFWFLSSRKQLWLFYYSWVVLFMLLAIVILGIASFRLRKGLETTGEMRSRILTNGIRLNALYMIWSSALITLYSTKNNQMVALIHSAHGVVNLLVFVAINPVLYPWACINRAERIRSLEARMETQPELNVILQKQLIETAAVGIVQTIEYFQDQQQVHSNTSFNLDWQLSRRQKRMAIPLSGARKAGEFRNKREMHFYDYQPQAFAIIRDLFGISHGSYLQSFQATINTANLTEGRSGAFVFYSQNRSFIVKSMTPDERRFLLSILPAYIQYLKWNIDTLLPKFFGCHTLKMYGQTFSFVVMGNIFAKSKSHDTIRRYDLKGSWVERSASSPVIGKTYFCLYCRRHYVHGCSECRESSQGHVRDITYRDNDLKSLDHLPPAPTNVVKQLIRDTNFLAGLGIMDYSLLIGVGRKYFYLGLIDILQTWTLSKQLERWYKVAILHRDGDGISAMAPKPYAKRFQTRIADLLVTSTST